MQECPSQGHPRPNHIWAHRIGNGVVQEAGAPCPYLPIATRLVGLGDQEARTEMSHREKHLDCFYLQTIPEATVDLVTVLRPSLCFLAA